MSITLHRFVFSFVIARRPYKLEYSFLFRSWREKRKLLLKARDAFRVLSLLLSETLHFYFIWQCMWNGIKFILFYWYAAGILIEERNWPPFFPIIHHDIARDIPVYAQRIQYSAFASWLGMSFYELGSLQLCWQWINCVLRVYTTFFSSLKPRFLAHAGECQPFKIILIPNPLITFKQFYVGLSSMMKLIYKWIQVYK